MLCMRRTLLTLCLILTACEKKDATSASAPTTQSKHPPKEPPPEKPKCEKGQAVEDGKCVAAITPEMVAGVRTQVDKLSEIEAVLGKAEIIAEPIAILNLLRKLEAWTLIAERVRELQRVDEVVNILTEAQKQLGTLKA